MTFRRTDNGQSFLQRYIRGDQPDRDLIQSDGRAAGFSLKRLLNRPLDLLPAAHPLTVFPLPLSSTTPIARRPSSIPPVDRILITSDGVFNRQIFKSVRWGVLLKLWEGQRRLFSENQFFRRRTNLLSITHRIQGRKQNDGKETKSANH